MATIFKYVTTPTGSLSGASMAQQTEDAINSIANTAEVARVTVLEAQTTIETALNTAKNAQTASEKGLIEIRQATQELSHLNIPSGDGNVGKFLGTDGTRLKWQGGMRFLGSVANVTELPVTEYTHGTLISGDISDSALETLQAVSNGGFNITVKGVLREISGLDFTGLTALSGIPAIINPKISDWGSCSYAETQETQTVTETLFPWVTPDATARIYAKESVLDSTDKLYNEDGSEYTGTAFVITATSDGSYVVMYGTETCIYTYSASITVSKEEAVTVRIITFITNGTGTSETISLGGAPTASEVSDISSSLQLASGTATNGQKVENLVGDTFYITTEQMLYFWNGSAWGRFTDYKVFNTVLTLSASIAQGTAITIPDSGTYVVGRNKLSVSYNGLDCYRGKNFEEIGTDGETSSVFKLLFDAKSGDEIEVTIA